MRRPPPKCPACGKPLLWARTEARSRWLPLDPKPDPAGNQAAWRDSDGTWKTRQLGPGADPAWQYERVFMPHAATCKPPEPKAPGPPNVIPVSPARWRQGATRRLPPRH